MGLDRIVCLANSYKHDNRCVAGISLITKKWVRLVSKRVPGCVTRTEASYSNGQDVALLDVFEAELAEKCCSNCHPEDVYVTEKPWRLLHRLDDEEYTNHLQEYVSKRPSVLQGYNDRVSVEKVIEVPRERSLELIQPEDLWCGFARKMANERTAPSFELAAKAASVTIWR